MRADELAGGPLQGATWFGVLCTTFSLLPLAVAGDKDTNALAPLPNTVAERAGPAVLSTEEVLRVNAKRLREQFDEWLKEPEAYRRRALRECSVFPEGRIYPFAVPALGYANVGLGDAKQRKHSAEQMKTLIDLLISTVVEDVSPPGGDLNRLARYSNQGTRLATLNLTLACYALISDDLQHSKLHDHPQSSRWRMQQVAHDDRGRAASVSRRSVVRRRWGVGMPLPHGVLSASSLVLSLRSIRHTAFARTLAISRATAQTVERTHCERLALWLAR